MTEEEAKERLFMRLGTVVFKEFIDAPIKDLIEFSQQLKKWAIESPLRETSVEKYMEKENFYTSKLKK